MINSELGHVKTVAEFQQSIREQQEAAHGKDYTAIHDAIAKYMVDCDSYMELGVHQGGTASAAMLTNPKMVQLVDIDMSRYYKFLSPLAEKYCAENNIQLNVKECDSRGLGAMASVDMLVIDSVHTAPFMKSELDVHGANVKKYILAHDTHKLFNKVDEQLHNCLVGWGNKNGFELIERGTTNVGYTVIKRK